jgi:hypothetical protein
MRDLRRAKPAPGVIREIVLRKLRVASVSETGYAGAYDKLLETFSLVAPCEQNTGWKRMLHCSDGSM